MIKYRADIDGLRAVAVLPVVLYHAGLPAISGGFVGVDVFFVISGFLITSIVVTEISENRFSLVSFYERRARRILPALTAVVLATFVAGWFVLIPSEFKDLGQSALSTALFLSNLYFMLKLDYFATAAEFAPLLHTWSLAVEEQFYLFYPPMLALLFATGGRKAACWVMVVLSVLSLIAAIVMLPINPEWVFYLIFFRLWELGVGALIALSILPAPRHRVLRDVVGLVGLLSILVPVFIYDSTTPFPGLAAIPPVFGAAAIIYVGTSGQGGLTNRMLSHPFLVWVGLISYSLYLWHWPIFAFLRIGWAQTTLPLIVSFVAVTFSILMAWASYKFIEHPFRARPPSGFSRRAIFLFSGTVLLAMVLIGGVLHISNGMPNRLTSQAALIAAVSQDRNIDRDTCFGRLARENLCIVGTSVGFDEPVDFLFWGDSHAEAMRPGLDIAAQAAGKNGLFIGATGCRPIDHVRRVPERRRCTEVNQAVSALLAERPDMQLVILSARWALSVEGSPYRHEEGSTITLEWSGHTDARPDGTGNASLVEAGLTATIEEILASGREVVILGPTPEIGWDVPNALVRKTMLDWLPELPTLTSAEFEERSGTTDEILSRVAAQHDGVRYVRLSDLFCTDAVCRIVGAGGLPLYVDDDHISQTTAKTLLPDRLSEIWTNGDR
jgi:peptidoglycan/LPS O-acetylase OafA/YrhL